MIVKAYPILYAREVTEAEVELGLSFLAAQREAYLEQELIASWPMPTKPRMEALILRRRRHGRWPSVGPQ